MVEEKKEINIPLRINGDYSFIKNKDMLWFENELLNAVGMAHFGLKDLKIEVDENGILFDSIFEVDCMEKHKIMMIYLKGLHIYETLTDQGYEVPKIWPKEELY